MKTYAVNRILVIRYRRVGDSILALSLIRLLKANFPEAEADFVLDSGISPLFDGHPDIHKVIAFTPEEKHHFLRYLAKVWKVVHDTRYDVIIDMRSTIQTLWFCLFSLHTKFRIGRRKGYNRFIQNYRPRISWDIDMEEQNAMFASPLNAVKPLCPSKGFSMPVRESDKTSFRKYMEEQGVDFSRPVVFCAVATRIPEKVWDKERMKVVLRHIIEKYDASLIFNYGGQAEEAYVRGIYEEMGSDEHIKIGIEAKGLPQLRAMLANCDFFFGNEGGPRHLAQSIGVPSFAVYPPHVGKHIWLPQNDGLHQGIEFADTAMANSGKDLPYQEKFAAITEKEVWSKVEPMLEKYLRKGGLA